MFIIFFSERFFRTKLPIPFQMRDSWKYCKHLTYQLVLSWYKCLTCCSCLVTALGVAGALTRWTQGSSRTRYRTSGWGIWAWSSRRRRRPCTRPSYASRRRASSQSLLLLPRRRRRFPDRWATHFRRRWFDRFDKKRKKINVVVNVLHTVVVGFRVPKCLRWHACSMIQLMFVWLQFAKLCHLFVTTTPTYWVGAMISVCHNSSGLRPPSVFGGDGGGSGRGNERTNRVGV